MVDDEENVSRRGTQLERYYQALFDLHWSTGTARSVELLKEMLGTEQLLPAPERSDEFVASRASNFFDQVEAMQHTFYNYTTREGRATVAPEHVLSLLEEMGVDFGPLYNDRAVQAARDRVVEILGGAGWAEIEAWYQDPAQRDERERIKAMAENALDATYDAPAARGVQRGMAQQEVASSSSIDDDAEVVALDHVTGRNRSIGTQLLQSVKETLAEPVARQLVVGDIPDDRPELEADADLRR